jgi:hypothetical protein
MNALRFNPFESGFTASPYEHYRQLREQDPVHKSFMGTWAITRHAEVYEVLRDASYSSELSRWKGFDRRYRTRPGVAWLLTRSLLNRDEPDHQRLRRTVVRAFSPADEARFAGIVSDVLRRQLTQLETAGAFDAIDDFAIPVPVQTICRVFDVAEDDRTRVKAWSNNVASLIEPLPTGPVLGDAASSVEAFKAYLARKMADPGDDGLAGALARAIENAAVDADDALANLVLMFPAGHETTINLIGNGLLLLLQHPEQHRMLREQPSLWPKAIEEMLRFESPQQIAWRIATEDRVLAGKHIAAGDQLMLLLGAANRDPMAFSEPDRFDIMRTPNKHVAFGFGRHACLGGWFARMQAMHALKAITERFPDLALIGEPQWHPTISFHGLRNLPVSVGRTTGEKSVAR